MEARKNIEGWAKFILYNTISFRLSKAYKKIEGLGVLDNLNGSVYKGFHKNEKFEGKGQLI